ncbi:MAG: GHKL domain-containing protein [Oscillospiraceae bacterium]|nr:GHKL domain-containing protein [Oscillospiraceae bacterium]
MILNILTWFFCGLCLALNVQFAGLILGYEPRNHRAVNILLTMLVTAPSLILVNRGTEDILPYPLRLGLFAFYILGQLGIYFLIYRKINIRLLYSFVFMANIPQIFLNFFDAFIGNYVLSNMISFAVVALLFASFIFIINRKGSRGFICDLVDSLPARLYITVLIFSYVASIHVLAENVSTTRAFISLFQLLSMTALIAAAVTVTRISISETEKRSTVELLSRQMEHQIEYYEKINKIYGEFRSFRHDYKNHVLCLRGLIASGRTGEALEYMESMQDMSSIGKNKYNTGNVIVDALLDDKSDKAEKYNTELLFTGTVPSFGISNTDLCVIMANAIDNAIEACAKDETRSTKEIKLEAGTRQGYFFFRASNPVFGTIAIKDKHSATTSKSDKENHGFGISNILRTAEKYEGEATIDSENGIFTLSVQIHLKTE